MEAPDVNIGGLAGNLKGPDVKLPEVSVKTPKISMPDVDLHVKGPKVKGEKSCHLMQKKHLIKSDTYSP